jgi:hypothetical protein
MTKSNFGTVSNMITKKYLSARHQVSEQKSDGFPACPQPHTSLGLCAALHILITIKG